MIFLQPFPISMVNDRVREPLLTGEEILYRADYLEKGRIRRTAGVLSAGKEETGFFEKMDRDITDGMARAGSREFYIFLKFHFILCSLEEYAGKRKALAEKWRREQAVERKMWVIERLYCEELFAYVEKARERLNDSTSGIVLPVFPERSVTAGKAGV